MKLKAALKAPYRRMAALVPFTLKQSFLNNRTHSDVIKLLEEAQWWPPEKHMEYQLEKTRRIIEHAYATTEYYKTLYDGIGFDPAKFSSLEDIKRLPFISKGDLRTWADRFISANYDKAGLVLHRTGGSSGVPADLYRSKKGIGIENAFTTWFWGLHGFIHGRTRSSFFRGAYEKPLKHHEWNPAQQKLILSPFDLDERRLVEYCELLIKYKIGVHFGYPSLTFLLAEAAEKVGMKGRFPDLKTVLLSSEMVHDFQRDKIESVFDVYVREHYGQNEHVALFIECEEGRLHVVSEYGFVELLSVDDSDSISSGVKTAEIVSTGFHEDAFPLIRYRTADLVELASEEVCSCGRTWPVVVKRIVGRSGDVIKTKSGRLVGPTHLSYSLRHMKNFKDVQIVQEELDRLNILIVPDDGYEQKDGLRFAEDVLKRIGEPLDFELTIVERILRPGIGKKRYVLSRLHQRS